MQQVWAGLGLNVKQKREPQYLLVCTKLLLLKGISKLKKAEIIFYHVIDGKEVYIPFPGPHKGLAVLQTAQTQASILTVL